MFNAHKKQIFVTATAITVTSLVVGAIMFLQPFTFDNRSALVAGGNCSFVTHPLGLSEKNCTGPSLGQEAESALKPGIELDKTGVKVDLVSGEKTIFAGIGTYMAAAIVETADGQLVSDGTLVSFFRNGSEVGTARTVGGIAYAMDGSITGAGEYTVVAQSLNASSASNTIRVVAGEPVSLSIAKGDGIAKPENESFIKLRTGFLEDRFGNVIPDGSLLQFQGKDAQGLGIILNSLVINGISSVDLPGRELSGAVLIEPRLKEISGSGLQLDIDKVVLAETIQTITHVREGIVDLEIGPVVTTDGKLVHDGLPFTIKLNDGRRIETRTSNGVANFHFTHPAPGSTATVELVSGPQFWRLPVDYASEAASISQVRGGDAG